MKSIDDRLAALERDMGLIGRRYLALETEDAARKALEPDATQHGPVHVTSRGAEYLGSSARASAKVNRDVLHYGTWATTWATDPRERLAAIESELAELNLQRGALVGERERLRRP